ncbi:MAG: hypothetical protein ACI97A_002782, partial [Planctomycetota bacterium]
HNGARLGGGRFFARPISTATQKQNQATEELEYTERSI